MAAGYLSDEAARRIHDQEVAPLMTALLAAQVCRLEGAEPTVTAIARVVGFAHEGAFRVFRAALAHGGDGAEGAAHDRKEAAK